MNNYSRVGINIVTILMLILALLSVAFTGFFMLLISRNDNASYSLNSYCIVKCYFQDEQTNEFNLEKSMIDKRQADIGEKFTIKPADFQNSAKLKTNKYVFDDSNVNNKLKGTVLSGQILTLSIYFKLK